MSYPPPPQQPMPADTGGKRKLRGRIPLRLALIFGVLGIALLVIGIVVIGTKSLSKVNDFERVSIAGGGGKITLNDPGKVVGYYEASDVTSSTDQIPPVTLQILDPSGNPVTFTSYGDRSDGKIRKFTYSYNGHDGIAAIQFTVTKKGTYTVRARAGASVPSGAQIAFGPDIVKSTVVGALLIIPGVLLLVAAIVLLIVGLVRRSRHKRELASGPYPGGPPAGGWPPPGGQQGWPPPGGQQGWPPPGDQPPPGQPQHG